MKRHWKLKLTDSAERMIESADEEPFRTFNSMNNISAERFFDILGEIEQFVLKFERETGMRSASKWIGERLSDAVSAGRTTVKSHLEHLYFSMFDVRSGTSFILMENYEILRVGFFRRRYKVYDLSVPRFILIRIIHEDTHAHILSDEYANLYAELLQIARDEAERAERNESAERAGIIRISPRISAPVHVIEIEEKIARGMQRYAINAFLIEKIEKIKKIKKIEKCDEIIGIFGTPLFVMPDGYVMKCISDMIHRASVEFKAGYLSEQQYIREYARSLRQGVDDIYERARTYLHRNVEFLKDVVKCCLNGDYRILNAARLL